MSKRTASQNVRNGQRVPDKRGRVARCDSPQCKEVLKILYNVQKDKKGHSKYKQGLHGLYKTIGHDEFQTVFINCLKQLIAIEESQARYANVGLEFMAKFTTSFDSEDLHELPKGIFDWMLKTVSLDSNVRSRMCRFTNLLLESLGSTGLPNELYLNILEYMLDRIKDFNPMVRVEAIKVLKWLQTPDDHEDPVFKIYAFHLASDPSTKARQTVLTCLARNVHTIPIILDRLWDIDDRVRRHVFVHMSNYPVKLYTIAHRLILLEQGLNDRSDSVRKIVTSILIPQWLELYEKNYLHFLTALILDNTEAAIERFRVVARPALFEIFKKQNPEDIIQVLCLDSDENGTNSKCISFEKLTIESSIFWWALITYFQKEDPQSNYLEVILPELSEFCAYIQKYNDNIINGEDDESKLVVSQHILLHLLEILLALDYDDQIGRNYLRSLTTHLITTNPCNENIIKLLVKIVEKLIEDSNERLDFYAEVICGLVGQDSLDKILSDPVIIESLENDSTLKIEVSLLKMKLFALKEEESKFEEEKDYANLSRITEAVTACHKELIDLVRPFLSSNSYSLQRKRITNELKTKALKLAFHGVCSKNVSKLNEAMCSLYNDFIRVTIESSDLVIRNWALKCGATFSLLYKRFANDIFTVLHHQFFDNQDVNIWITSVGAVFQLIVRYGFSYFEEDRPENLQDSTTENLQDSARNENGIVKQIVNLFGHFIDTCDNIDLLSALVDGFGLLVLHGRYTDQEIISKLLLLFFNPTTAPQVTQILSILFQTLVQQKQQAYLVVALIETLKRIIESSDEDPLREVKLQDLLKFVIDSTMPEYCKSGDNLHDKMAISLFQYMNAKPENKELIRITSKQILLLVLSDDNGTRQKLQDYLNQLLENPLQSKSKEMLKSFENKIKDNTREAIRFSSTASSTIGNEADDHPNDTDENFEGSQNGENVENDSGEASATEL